MALDNHKKFYTNFINYNDCNTDEERPRLALKSL